MFSVNFHHAISGLPKILALSFFSENRPLRSCTNSPAWYETVHRFLTHSLDLIHLQRDSHRRVALHHGGAFLHHHEIRRTVHVLLQGVFLRFFNRGIASYGMATGRYAELSLCLSNS